jgi:hypothetical protein
VTNESLALSQPGGASVLENWFPTQTGIKVRGGSRRVATVSTTLVESLLNYASGAIKKVFAGTDGKIVEWTNPVGAGGAPPSMSIPASSVTGQTSNYYSYVQFATVGGDFMIAVNGTDSALVFNGTSWEVLDEATRKIAFDAQTANYTSGLTITGATSGATGVIVAVVDNGTTGTLRVKTVVGTFVDNELITDSATGSATANIPTGAVTIPAVTGILTSKLSQVWIYKNRLFFVEKGKKKAWYLPVDSIGGAALEVSLDGVFQKGGALSFGATWSMDAGDGLDDKCVFVSTNGEAVIFEGANPSDANNWALVGRYDISVPIGIRGTMRAGGDLLIATVAGIVPISQAVNKDPAALSLAAITRAIEPEWHKETSSRVARPWEIAKWSESNMAVVSMPGNTTVIPTPSLWGTMIWGDFTWGANSTVVLSDQAQCFVVNLETGAWAKYIGWDVQCTVIHDGKLYFGTSDGRIMQAEVGGTDDGAPYYCRYAGLFESMGSRGSVKHIMMARPTFTYSQDFISATSVATNYVLSFPPTPSSVPTSALAEGWDVSKWDQSVWDTGVSDKVRARWISIGRNGYSVAPTVQVTCAVLPTPNAELVSIDVTYSNGGVVV